MGMTMTQKILAAHAGLESVKAGDLIEAKLDLVLGNDTKLVEDYKGNKLLLFSSFWSIKWVSDHNPQLVLTEFNEKNNEDDE